jgi:hypothetical protein
MLKIAWSAFLDPVIRRDAEEAGARFLAKPTECASVSALLNAEAAIQSQPSGVPSRQNQISN